MKKTLPKRMEEEISPETLANLYLALDNAVAASKPMKFMWFVTEHYDTDDAKSVIARHKRDMLQAIVYSKECEMMFAMYDHSMHCMSGFLERTGRLPNKNDKIQVVYGQRYFETHVNVTMGFDGFFKHGITLLSDINFEIINTQ